MSAIRQANSKSLMLFSGRAFPELTTEIAGHLGVTPTPTAAYEFANGELFVRFEESVRGCDAFVVQSHTAPINTWLMEQLIMVDALKRASAKRITVVAPVTVGDGAYTAAGSVITSDVPPGAMAVARAPQRNVAGWVRRRRSGTPAAEAAAAAESRAEAAAGGRSEASGADTDK